jgi:hypothetical protein
MGNFFFCGQRETPKKAIQPQISADERRLKTRKVGLPDPRGRVFIRGHSVL